MAKIKIISKSLEDTFKIGSKIAKTLKKSSVLAFFGTLGSGKTTLIKAIVESLNKNQNINVNSPTFTYLNIYNLKIPIYHFDLYRIKDKNHFYSFGFEEYLSSDGICLIEWAENIKDILKKDTLIIELKHISEKKREILLSKDLKNF